MPSSVTRFTQISYLFTWTYGETRVLQQLIVARLAAAVSLTNSGRGLKFRVSLRIDQPADALCRGKREPHRHQLARRRRQAMLRRFAKKMRAIGVGDDQASILWKKIAAQILREGEEQPVAMGAVVLPFVIGAEILHRRFDLDDPDLAALVQRHQIGAPARRQRQFANAGKSERTQQPRGAARDQQRRLRLTAVRRGHEADLAGGRFHFPNLSDFRAVRTLTVGRQISRAQAVGCWPGGHPPTSRPRESGDPYSVPSRLENAATDFFTFQQRWLWV